MSQDNKSERITVALEAWKTVVGVQEHFNTIEMQIRSLAVTVVTASIGAAVLVHNQASQAMRAAVPAGASVGTTLTAPATTALTAAFPAAKLLVLGGLAAWAAFYFMDRWWYHRYLKAATDQASAIAFAIERDTDHGDILGLSAAISAASPITVGNIRINSEKKIDIFYSVIGLVVFGVALVI